MHGSMCHEQFAFLVKYICVVWNWVQLHLILWHSKLGVKMQGLFNHERLLLLYCSSIPHKVKHFYWKDAGCYWLWVKRNSCQSPFISLKSCKSQRFVPPLDSSVLYLTWNNANWSIHRNEILSCMFNKYKEWNG